MTVLTVFYKLLYNKNSTEPGTLYAEKIRLSRCDAHGDDVKHNYDHCKELAVSVIDSYITEAAMEYFKMDTPDSEKCNFPVNMKDLPDSEKQNLILQK